MQSPPPFAPPVRKNNNTVLIVVLVILGVLGLCCVGLFFVGFSLFNKMKGFMGCTVNFAYAEQAVNGYVREKHKYPPAATWQDDIIPYWPAANSDDAKVGKIFGAANPSQDLGCKGGENGPSTGMAYNKEIAGKAPSKVLPTTVVVFEVPTTGRNQAMVYKPQPGRSPQQILGKQRPWEYMTAGGTSSLSSRSGSFSSSSSIDDRDTAPPDLGKDIKDDSGDGDDTSKTKKKSKSKESDDATSS